VRDVCRTALRRGFMMARQQKVESQRRQAEEARQAAETAAQHARQLAQQALGTCNRCAIAIVAQHRGEWWVGNGEW
jgi:ubiquitin